MEFLVFLISYAVCSVVTFAALPRIKNNTIASIVKVGIVVVFAILVYTRPLYFRDTQAYISAYELSNWDYIKHYNILAKEPNTNMEYGFVLLMLIFKSFGFSFRGFSTICAVAFLCAYYHWSCRVVVVQNDSRAQRGQYFLTFFAVFIPLYGIFYCFVAMRSMVSFVFLIMSYLTVQRRRFVWSIVFLALAISIQRLSILGGLVIAILIFWNRRISSKAFLFAWLALGLSLLAEYRIGILMGGVGMPIQAMWNKIMVTGVAYGFNAQTQSLKLALSYLAYWSIGLAYYISFDGSRERSRLYLIYLISLLALVILCRFSAANRLIDYLYLIAIPLNYSILIGCPRKLKHSSQVVVAASQCMFMLSWGYSYYQWIFDV